MAYFDKYGVEFTDDRKTLVRCPNEYEGEYDIPDGVIYIGEKAFVGCRNVSSIKIPTSVTAIGEYAFCLCDQLHSIEIPTSVTYIGKYAFRESGLSSTIIPDSVVELGVCTFGDCKNLISVILTSNLKTIPVALSARCFKLKHIDIPASVNTIGSGAFEESGITYLKIPNGIKHIEERLCYKCSSLEYVELPNTLETIKDCAFLGCCIHSLAIPNSVKYIGKSAFEDCSLTSIQIPTQIKEICERSFYRSGLENIILPIHLERIGDRAFWGCCRLSSITIPDSVTSIEAYAFRECTHLRDIHLPVNLLTIGEFAFDCCCIGEVTIPSNVNFIGAGAFTRCIVNIDSNNSNFFVHEGALFSRNGELIVCNSKDSEIRIPESTTIIGKDAFIYCDAKAVYLPKNIEKIEKFAFANSNIFELHISKEHPNNVELDHQAFIGKYDKIRLFVPKQSIDGYRNHPVFRRFSCIITE